MLIKLSEKSYLFHGFNTIMYHKFYCYTSQLKICIFQLEENVLHVVGQNSLTGKFLRQKKFTNSQGKHQLQLSTPTKSDHAPSNRKKKLCSNQHQEITLFAVFFYFLVLRYVRRLNDFLHKKQWVLFFVSPQFSMFKGLGETKITFSLGASH